jgi:hypothetical protein
VGLVLQTERDTYLGGVVGTLPERRDGVLEGLLGDAVGVVTPDGPAVDDDRRRVTRRGVVESGFHLRDRRPAGGVVETPEVPGAEGRVKGDRHIPVRGGLADGRHTVPLGRRVEVLPFELGVVEAQTRHTVEKRWDCEVEPQVGRGAQRRVRRPRRPRARPRHRFRPP